MTDALKAWSVTLSFAAPGPLRANMLLAPDAASAGAMAMHVFMMNTPTAEPLQAVIAAEIPAETLRHMLRAVEGKLPASGNAQVVSLVPAAPQQALAPDDVRLGPHRRLTEDRVCVYGEQFGPPMPSQYDLVNHRWPGNF